MTKVVSSACESYNCSEPLFRTVILIQSKNDYVYFSFGHSEYSKDMLSLKILEFIILTVSSREFLNELRLKNWIFSPCECVAMRNTVVQ